MKIAVVIPTFNRRDNIKALLMQLQSINTNTHELIPVVVIDGSTDGTQAMLSMEFPNVYQVHGTGNWWYTRSMNEGFRFCDTLQPDYVLTLNDDIVLDSQYIKAITDAIIQVQNGSVIGSISYTMGENPKLQFAGVKEFIKWRYKNIHYYPALSTVEPNALTGIKPSVVLPGRGMLIPFNVLKELNYFDEFFIQYQSDGDFCLRAARAGYNVYISWDARIYSYIEKTGSGTSYIKTPFKKFFKSFFNKYSRTYLPNNALFIYRHCDKVLWPVTMCIFIITAFKAHFLNKKI
jgi:GT2 family glycosyltransferase